jgi:hypothetical protein
MRKVQLQFVIVFNSYRYVDIDSNNGISHAAYAIQDKGNQSSSGANNASEEFPASINGTIQCMREGQYYSEEFGGKEVKHCNFMMANQYLQTYRSRCCISAPYYIHHAAGPRG